MTIVAPPGGWTHERIEADPPKSETRTDEAPPEVVPFEVGDVWSAGKRAAFAAALYDAMRNCVCGAPIPVVEKPVAPLARTFIRGEHEGKPVRIVSGLMPLGPVLREPEGQRSSLMDRHGNALVYEPTETVPAKYAALFDDRASEDEKRTAFEALDAEHPLGRPFRRALNERAHVRCFRCGGNITPTSPNIDRPGDAGMALMRAARGEDVPEVERAAL